MSNNCNDFKWFQIFITIIVGIFIVFSFAIGFMDAGFERKWYGPECSKPKTKGQQINYAYYGGKIVGCYFNERLEK